ncbi:glycoside hydrolase family 125 protein [Flavobacterium sp.]|jgi:meiotically up-regulated gene 157 (Mug157) protein|uniref:glycoside hydrolase family 125 protein n=1 Tax=Flavobacterium sp. TaxID=239 RepID=UPI0037BF98CF
MVSRRKFIINGSLVTLGTSLSLTNSIFSNTLLQDNLNFISKRPPLQKRKFVSEAVEQTILSIKKKIADPELAWMFENCFPNTLDTTIKHYSLEGKPDTFVITGDIDAMWLRDSSAQVWPYIPLVTKDKKLSLLIAGVVNRQTKCVLIDPYANAFNYGPELSAEHTNDKTEMKPGVFERKFEVDSLCYVIRLAHEYWKISGNLEPYDADWAKAMKLIVQTFKEQQRKTDAVPYSFRRTGDSPNDTAQGQGYGNPVRPIGLICSVFRPSDDGTLFPFLVPSNYFAVVSLRQLAEMSTVILKDHFFAKECDELANEIQAALEKYAIVNHFEFGKVFAYEIDGYGSVLHMDDANVPSLISLPYIANIDPNSEVYQNTRKLVLSSLNPYYAQGKYSGVGGPHTGKEMIWPLSYIMRAMTSKNNEEIKYCIRMIQETHADTGFIHESFFRNDPKQYTRDWFAWANTIFGELIVKLANENRL